MRSILWTQGRKNDGAICTEEGVVTRADSSYQPLYKEFLDKDKVKSWDYETREIRVYSDSQMTIVSGLFSDVDDMGRRVAYSLITDLDASQTLKRFSHDLGYSIPKEHFRLIDESIQHKKKKTRFVKYIIVSITLCIVIGLLFIIFK